MKLKKNSFFEAVISRVNAGNVEFLFNTKKVIHSQQLSQSRDIIKREINRSECDHLLQFPTKGGKGTVINRRRPIAVKTKPATCFALRGERFASSSRLMVLSLLGNKDGTRTIEMILVSTVLT